MTCGPGRPALVSFAALMLAASAASPAAAEAEPSNLGVYLEASYSHQLAAPRNWVPAGFGIDAGVALGSWLELRLGAGIEMYPGHPEPFTVVGTLRTSDGGGEFRVLTFLLGAQLSRPIGVVDVFGEVGAGLA